MVGDGVDVNPSIASSS